MSKPNPKRGTKPSSRKTTARDNAEKDESTDRTTVRSAVPGSGTGSGTGGGGVGSATRTPTDADAKDETTTNGEKVKTPDDAAAAPAAPKPQSASVTIRDAGQKLLTLTMKQEWNSIDPVLKQLEKVVAAGGGETHTAPLAGLADPVSSITYLSFEIWVKVISGFRAISHSHRTCVMSTRPIFFKATRAQFSSKRTFRIFIKIFH